MSHRSHVPHSSTMRFRGHLPTHQLHPKWKKTTKESKGIRWSIPICPSPFSSSKLFPYVPSLKMLFTFRVPIQMPLHKDFLNLSISPTSTKQKPSLPSQKAHILSALSGWGSPAPSLISYMSLASLSLSFLNYKIRKIVPSSWDSHEIFKR